MEVEYGQLRKKIDQPPGLRFFLLKEIMYSLEELKGIYNVCCLRFDFRLIVRSLGIVKG